MEIGNDQWGKILKKSILKVSTMGMMDGLN
jgi:hypothetical protein